MIEFLLVKEDDSPITIKNFHEENARIKSLLPQVETKDLGRTIRGTYGNNGSTIHIYYGDKKSQIFIPLAYEKLIKEKLKSINIKCQ